MSGDDDDANSSLEESPSITTTTEDEETLTQQISSTHESFEENNNKTSGNNEPSSSSSTTTGIQPELNIDTSSNVLAKGVSLLLGTVMRDFDFKAENALQSQDQLCSAIDRLTRELDQLLEDAPVPFIMQNAAKISGVRKRVSSLNSLLKSIQRRVDNIDRMLSTGLPHGIHHFA
ncbi:hypothetical protein AQUCO_02600326v1 [Aquilegia coerulea]|uniref:Biogenesis of lysosome-related organelles complex 1 subunit 7 n=1 Tax=Aquilegia coerulea TaxID=218851 RepID=A0A2G5D8E8_AQUCA|nr:hypothetical protein AQUCO_02600326v1 [Aquilegia coerulea]